LKRAPSGPVFFMRPARAHSCGCRSRRELITANEVKRNCMRVTECGRRPTVATGRFLAPCLIEAATEGLANRSPEQARQWSGCRREASRAFERPILGEEKSGV